MRVILRTAIGMALFAGGLTFLVYGIAQSIENGSCGTDEYGRSIGPACPDGFGPMIMLMIAGAFVAFLGAVLASGGFIGIAKLLLVGIIAIPAAVVFGIVDLHDDDTRPGNEIMIAVLVPVLAVSIPTLGRTKKPPGARDTPVAQPVVMANVGGSAAPQFTPVASTPAATPSNPEDIASRLRQLEQLKESGLLGEDEYTARRRQILSEL